jgi:hypothetical protein
MARFKNLGQPNYGQFVGFEECPDTTTLNKSEIEGKQLYLNPVSSHVNGLSDLKNTIPSKSASDPRLSYPTLLLMKCRPFSLQSR